MGQNPNLSVLQRIFDGSLSRILYTLVLWTTFLSGELFLVLQSTRRKHTGIFVVPCKGKNVLCRTLSVKSYSRKFINLLIKNLQRFFWEQREVFLTKGIMFKTKNDQQCFAGFVTLQNTVVKVLLLITLYFDQGYQRSSEVNKRASPFTTS